MLVRYRTTDTGAQEKLADIFTISDHGLSRNAFEAEALYIIRRLNRAGYDAYVVGGAIRDLLLKMRPKDYDVVTNALPRKIRRIFRNSRIIGKRFQLVHVYFQDKIIEVSTFRTDEPADSHNIFGTMAEDVRRRDFTFNALYYDPREEYIIDYVDGYADITGKRLKGLIPLDNSFNEDPVRMIRAIRYASTTGFRLTGKITKQIRKCAGLIEKCPVSRLTEELFKMLESGQSQSILSAMRDCDVLSRIMPNLAGILKTETAGIRRERLFQNLENLDGHIAQAAGLKRSDMILALAKAFIDVDGVDTSEPHTAQKDVFRQIKEIIAPLTPPNADVQRAADKLLGIDGGTGRTAKRRRGHQTHR